MHKLDRARVAAPACLSNYDYETQTWDDFGSDCKKELRKQLGSMQGRRVPGSEDHVINLRCAYCEEEIFSREGSRHGHIEHFRRKNPVCGFPQLTFSWENLFLSCDSQDHCGHFKDSKGASVYNPDSLIKPDETDPDDLLFFHSNGIVRPREGLTGDDQNRANETINTFNLNEPALKGKRAKAVGSYLKRVKSDLEEIASWNEKDRQDFFRQEIEETCWDSFATTIRHFFQRAG
ncbi:retron system putative HNH endonuclease [Rhodospirillum sp. A1_3_36]|uniref:retron system putative HNH endonuclease n=1 Tax=Rhodospirillum sp. A1_3_36 TaxID=3391666 RepID=UPI0039A498DB